MSVSFKKNEYNKFANRLRYFTQLLGKTPYALVGAGSCAEKIVHILEEKGWQLPKGIYDHQQVDKSIGPFRVAPLTKLDSEFVLIGNIGHEVEVKQRIAGVENNPVKHIAAIADFSPYRSKRLSAHPILVNCMPKTGTFYIRDVIEKSLDLDHQGITEGQWPHLEISEGALKKCLDTCGLSVSHLKATSWTREILKVHGVQKTVVHVRDPRQSLVSWVHHLDKIQHVERFAHHFFSRDDYFEMSFEEKINYQLTHFLPQACEYIAQWLRFEEEGSVEILFTDFTLMKHDPQTFFTRLLDFFEVETSKLKLPQKKAGELNFRKGDEEEWRSVLTAEQLEAVNSLVTRELRTRFEWPD